MATYLQSGEWCTTCCNALFDCYSRSTYAAHYLPYRHIIFKGSPERFFFDTYTESLQQNLPKNSKACIQAVNSSRLFWLKALFKGEFSDYPGVRLYVEIGDLRLANAEELAQISRRIQSLKWTKGSQLIWSDFTHVCDFQVQAFRWVKYPKMMPFA